VLTRHHYSDAQFVFGLSAVGSFRNESGIRRNSCLRLQCERSCNSQLRQHLCPRPTVPYFLVSSRDGGITTRRAWAMFARLVDHAGAQAPSPGRVAGCTTCGTSSPLSCRVAISVDMVVVLGVWALRRMRNWVNGPAGQRLGLAPVPDTPVSLRALRRTLAIELAYRPGGMLAARWHLKHIAVATTEGYVSKPGGAKPNCWPRSTSTKPTATWSWSGPSSATTSKASCPPGPQLGN
jgi:hypothetical protein